jgi:hypothetical protein
MRATANTLCSAAAETNSKIINATTKKETNVDAHERCLSPAQMTQQTQNQITNQITNQKQNQIAKQKKCFKGAYTFFFGSILAIPVGLFEFITVCCSIAGRTGSGRLGRGILAVVTKPSGGGI